MKAIIFIMLCWLSVSCSHHNEIPPGVIEPVKMQHVLWDVIRAQALSAELARKDSTLNEVAESKALTQKVFTIYKISPQLFSQSYSWYTSHPDVMQVMFDSITAQQERISQQELDSKRQKIDSQKLNILKKAKQLDLK